MKILVYGAGVLGSVYAAKLQQAGNQVSILARGQRLADIREHGLVLEDHDTGTVTTVPVNVVERLEPNDFYELVIVLVRKNQLSTVLPALAANRRIPHILFMVNNAVGPQELIAAVGRERVLLGFPGAGGQRDGHLIRYHVTPAGLQATTLGELDGLASVRLNRIISAFRAAGFPVAISSNMDAWLKTHAALVSPIANAVYLAGGDIYRLAKTRDGLVLMVRAIREGFQVLHALDIPIVPARFHFIEWIPEPLLVAVLRRGLATPKSELIISRHANVARDEMSQISAEFLALARKTNVRTPAMDQLARYVDPAEPAVPEAQETLPLDWSGVWAWLAGLSALLLTVRWVSNFRRKK
jgi:2-dehydropantoate 2-reductase